MATIQIRGLVKQYGPVTAVNSLSFDVPPGTVTGFLGPNGAGKTTTLRILLGLVSADAGSATIDGRPTASCPSRCTRPARCSRRRLPSGPDCPRAAADPGAGRGRRRVEDRGRPRPDGAHRRGGPPDRRVLARHAAAARPGHRAAPRPGGADPRRAGQRARPGGRPLAARTAARVRRGRGHRAGVQPPARRGRADRRLGGDHQQRPPGRAGPGGRADRRRGGPRRNLLPADREASR